MKFWIALALLLSATCMTMAADGWFPGPQHAVGNDAASSQRTYS
ncbi:hypothetical protein [Klebsiella sp. RIT-PI-d]|nr:hypothetical protein [Klebsiella sp. RIT-PI-d]